MAGPFAVILICVPDDNRNRRWEKIIPTVSALGGTRGVTGPGRLVPESADCRGSLAVDSPPCRRYTRSCPCGAFVPAGCFLCAPFV